MNWDRMSWGDGVGKWVQREKPGSFSGIGTEVEGNPSEGHLRTGRYFMEGMVSREVPVKSRGKR